MVMKIVAGFVVLGWFLCGLLLIESASSYASDMVGFEPVVEATATASYDRIDEVKKHCASVLSGANDLRDRNRVNNLKQDLSFVNGDWWQDMGKAEIVPYVDRESRHGGNVSYEFPAIKLVSFWVTDVDHAHQSQKSVNVNGYLVMGMTRGTFQDMPYDGRPEFLLMQGHTQLSISFQGVYTESKRNGGERIMCLLGSAVLPSRESESSDTWEWAKGSGIHQPPLLQDDQILLVLHYPMSFTLTNRAINGEMSSLNMKSNLKYFDNVHILSQLGKSTKYEFGSENLVSKACNPYPSTDSLVDDGIDVYKGARICEIIWQITGDGSLPFEIMPNWRCNGTDAICSKLGPFPFNKEINSTDGSFTGVNLFMQNVMCEKRPPLGGINSARIAAVFRVVPPSNNVFAAAARSGLGNMTVSAEGIWKSSSGQLCMICCTGLVNAEGSSCNSRICMNIPNSFSIKQRSTIVGSFSSLNKDKVDYFPLSFRKQMRASELWNYFRDNQPHYTYSRLARAGSILEKNEPFSFQTIVKKSLLQFPKLEDSESLVNSNWLLSEDLTIHSSAFPDPLPRTRTRGTGFELEILTVGPFFVSSRNVSNSDEEMAYHTKAQYTEKQLLVNLSAQITLNGAGYTNFSALSLEGLYDPHVGKMYLSGCREVRASWSILLDSMDLESGFDCSIEVVVSYPPATARWLINPTAKISISSQRNDDDPLRFATINLQTLPLMYRKQREGILTHRALEGSLRIVTLTFAVACILSQLFYLKRQMESVPFISIVTLGVQALGYGLPLITDAEAIFRNKSSSESYYNYRMGSYYIEKNQWIQTIDYMVNLLVLISFLLTLRLCQKVWKSRARLQSQAPLEPHRVPSDKLVLFAMVAIHAIGYVLVLIIHPGKKQNRSEVFIDSVGDAHKKGDWETELDEYIGLVQDFFLLPQVIANLIWQIDCKPLNKLYFIGITTVRLLPHLYDYLRAPLVNPYFTDEYGFVDPSTDFFSKFGDIAIPTIAILLAIAVYIQQKWSYEKLSQILMVGRYRLLPSRSRAYTRLSSKPLETELGSSSINGSDQHDAEQGNHE